MTQFTHCKIVALTPVVLVLTQLTSFSALAQPVAADKSGYSIFNPTPNDLMRDLSTDRPDKTESPYTVDAGHFQIESDLVSYSHDKPDQNTKVDSFSVMPTNLKVGLTNSMDLQVVVTPYLSEKVSAGTSPSDHKTGLGDTTVRLKINLMGNDSGLIAIGLMPFVKVPTAAGELGNKKVEGGLIFPIALSLPSEWDMGLMTQLNASKNELDEGFHTEVVSTMTVSHDIVSSLGGYLELFSQTSDEIDARWIATFDAGLTYGINSNLQLDLGANIGLTKAADDLNPFLGLSARF